MLYSDQRMAQRLKELILRDLVNTTGLTSLKAAGSTPGGNYGHGPGGLFANPALERPLYSAVVATPFSGLQYALPVRGTTVTDALDGIITGVTDTSGSEPNGPCDDPPTTGLMKLCQHSFPLGRFSRQTPVFDVSYGNRLESRGEHRDFVYLGDPFKAGNPFVPGFPLATGDQALNDNDAKVIFAWMIGWARDFAQLIYTGNPANNTAGRGYKEFWGLNRLINTGYQDAETGQNCPAADSIVRSFFNINVRSNSASIVTTLLQTYFVLQSNAARMGLAPATWAITMNESLFYELTAIWPCAYLTDGCTLTGAASGARVNVDAGDQIRMRDEMRADLRSRTGQHLKMFGQDVPVIIDESITETGLGGGQFSSTIYFVPLTVLGGQPVTYMEYMDYNAINTPEIAKKWAGDGDYTVSDNGRFLLHKKPPTNFCVQVLGLTEPRLKLLTPFLAARVQSVAYNRLPDLRSGFPDDPYFVNGGVTNRNQFAPSWFPPTE